MKTFNNKQEWSTSLSAVPKNTEETPRPKIGDDDGVSDKVMNALIVLMMILTMGVSIATAAATDEIKYRIILRQAMLDMDRMHYDKAVVKLLEVRANTESNANVDHMLGLCYLYGQGAVEKAVFYLNRAAQNTATDYQVWDLDETRAPSETAYHLAKAYESLEDYAKAAEFYGQFLASLDVSELKLSTRTYAIISKNAKQCELAAVEQAEKSIPDNVVINK